MYHSADHPASNVIVDAKSVQSKILTKALEHIPQHGFNTICVTQAIRDMEYPDSLVSAITSDPEGNSTELQLMVHWLKVQRQKLEEYVMDPESEFHTIGDEYDRASHLLKKRLLFNEPIVKQLSNGIGHLVLPYNLSRGLDELHNLSDDIAFYAGDASHDFAWYSKRLGFSSAYVSSELYMLQDSSVGFSKTKEFVDARVALLRDFGYAYNSVEQWGLFNAISTVNLIKSQLLRG